MKSCRQHARHIESCEDCVTAEVTRDQQATMLVLILVALVTWAAFVVSGPDHTNADADLVGSGS